MIIILISPYWWLSYDKHLSLSIPSPKVTTLSMALVQVQSGLWVILRCPLVRLLALLPALLSLLLSLCHWVVVSTFRHNIVAPLRVSRLAIPHVALMLTTRSLMHARMSSLQTSMPM